MVASIILVCLFAAYWFWPRKSEALPQPQVPASPQIPNGPRYAILKGSEAFTDREAVAELINAEKQLPKDAGNEDRLKVFKPLRHRQLSEGRRVDITRSRVVRFIENAPDLEGYCRVFAENAPKKASPYLWIQKCYLLDGNDLLGSHVLTGFWVFRGDEGTEIGGQYVTELKDVIAAVYEGEMKDELATQCVFMPSAQSGEVENLVDDFAIYRENHPAAQRLIHFAIKRSGNDDPLFSGPVRYIGRESFTTRNGTVRLIPVLTLEKGIK